MTEPVKRTAPTTQAPKTQQKPQQKVKESKPNCIHTEAKTPSTAKLAVNRAGAVVMAPVAAGAGVLTLAGSFLNGLFNPNTTLDESMAKGCQAAGQGADMLDKMWQGKFF